MHYRVKLRRMGGSVGATLPKDLVDQLRIQAGDEVIVVRTAEGLLLTPYDQDVADGLAVAEKAQKRYRNALRKLAE